MSVGTIRYAAVLSVARPAAADASPPGIDPEEFRLALLEDTYEVVAGLELVTPALVLDPPEPPRSAAEGRLGPAFAGGVGGVPHSDSDQPAAEAITWPGTAIVRERGLPAAFAALGTLGAQEAVLVAPDAPDLPPLLIGKLFRALGGAPASACQAQGPGGPDGLVALAARLPLPAWLDGALADVDLDTPDVLARLRAAAPRPGQVPQGPGWHRLRASGDVRLLDPGLEGWENTRALLEGHPLSS